MFLGIGSCDYAVMSAQAMSENPVKTHSATGLSNSIAAGQISYFYGMRGPSMAIDTACSSALAAVHLAVNSLRSGECRMALATSVSIISSPESSVIVCKARMVSPDSKCKTFDASADGYARGEAAAHWC